ncbi:unnamed protein product, partial [Oppiella nova]
MVVEVEDAIINTSGSEDAKNNRPERPERKTGSYIMESLNENNNTVHVVFSMKEKVGALADALQIFKDNDINLCRIESRSSKRLNDDYEFLVECSSRNGQLNKALDLIKPITQYMQVIARDLTHS